MSKMNELSMIVDQIRELSEKLSRLSDEIAELFTAQEDAPARVEEPKITLEDVRAVLARKTRVSKENTEAVRDLLKRHGAGRLSEIRPEDYAAVLKEAEVIPDA